MKCDKCNGTGKMLDQSALGTKLRARRKRLGIELTAVAHHMGRTPQFLWDLEYGRRRWTMQLRSKYLEALE